MRIIRAEEMGMCFGVRDALTLADQITDPSLVSIHGELVHNPEVNHRLAQAGFHQSPESNRDPLTDTPLVLITAHGVSDAERKRLQSHGKQLIDATCPLVRKVHEAAQRLESEGRHVLLIGQPGHVEVRGIVEDLTHYDVIGDPAAVKTYASQRLGIVCQTTMPPDLVEEICDRIRHLNPEAGIRLIDTVCLPTRLRQQAMLDLLHRVEAVVVVGGRNSNNTRRLVDLCHQHGKPAHHIQTAADLNPAWFEAVDTVGLTAGTSTLDETINEVHQALIHISAKPREGRTADGRNAGAVASNQQASRLRLAGHEVEVLHRHA